MFFDDIKTIMSPSFKLLSKYLAIYYPESNTHDKDSCLFFLNYRTILSGSNVSTWWLPIDFKIRLEADKKALLYSYSNSLRIPEFVENS